MSDGPDVTHTGTTICIQEVALYGQDLPLALPQGRELQAVSHDPGGPHLISSVLVALLSHHDIQEVRQWSRTGDHFVRLHWTFPGHSYPKFTTRHVLNTDDTGTEVSFSGGLAWAQDMLEATQELQFTNPSPPPVLVHLPVPGLPETSGGSQTLPQLFLPHGFHGSPDLVFPEDDIFLSSSPSDDQDSHCSELTDGATISDAGTVYYFPDAEEDLHTFPLSLPLPPAGPRQRCAASLQSRSIGGLRRSRRLGSAASSSRLRRPQENTSHFSVAPRNRHAQGQNSPSRRFPDQARPPPLPPPPIRLAFTPRPARCCAPTPRVSFPDGTVQSPAHVVLPTNDDWGGGLAGEVEQRQSNTFHREIQDARNMYARTGDTSGFLAVMASAPHNYVGTFRGPGMMPHSEPLSNHSGGDREDTE